MERGDSSRSLQADSSFSDKQINHRPGKGENRNEKEPCESDAVWRPAHNHPYGNQDYDGRVGETQ